MNCGFTLEHYKECIELAKDKGYHIVPVRTYNGVIFDKMILMRHDIDWSLENAYELANFEFDLNINSSYYVYLHSELYNALSPKSMKMIKEMKNMGHEIGLHADGDTYLSVAEDEILGDIIGPLSTYSSHNPSLTKKITIPYLTNPKDIKIKYISDSGRNWREGCMCKWIGNKDKLHILVHPEWWVSNCTTREDGINKLWKSQSETLVRNMTEIKQALVEYVRDDLKQK